MLPGKEHLLTLHNINGLGVLHTKQRQYDEAESLFNKALNGREHKLGEDHPDTLESRNDLTLSHKEHTRYEEAQKLLLKAVPVRRLKLGDSHRHTLESWHRSIDLYEAWDKSEKANEWRAKLPQTEAAKE